MKNITNIIVVLFLSLPCLVTGCSTMANAREEKGKGVAYIYEGSFEKVWETVPKALTSIRPFPPRITENNLKDSYLFAQGTSRAARNVSFGLSGTLAVTSEGQNFLIFIDKMDENRTAVEIVPERAFTPRVLAANWSPRIHRKLSETFKRVQ